MAKRLDHILVIDIESTCWDGGFPPRGETNDIIEIGLTPLELSTGRRLEKRSILVRPERSKVSPFCTQLTTLTQEQVDSGILFKDACKILETEYLSQERLWASFGDYDRKQFKMAEEPLKASSTKAKSASGSLPAVTRTYLSSLSPARLTGPITSSMVVNFVNRIENF